MDENPYCLVQKGKIDLNVKCSEDYNGSGTCIFYDLGYISVNSNSGGVWQKDYLGFMSLKPGQMNFADREWVISRTIPELVGKKNIQLKSVNVVDPIYETAMGANDLVKSYALPLSNYYVKSYDLSSAISSTGYVAIKVNRYINHLTDHNGNDKGQNYKFPWQLDAVEQYIYYTPLRFEITYSKRSRCQTEGSAEFPECCDVFPNNPACKNQCLPEVNEKKYCTNGINTSTYSDPKDWDDCILNNVKYKYNEILGNTNTRQNPYCSIYCREDDSTLFPGGGFTVEAGTYFRWNPIQFTGSRTCRATSNSKWHRGIDLDQFYKDWTTANREYQKYWLELYHYNQFELVDSRSGTVGCSSCSKDGSCTYWTATWTEYDYEYDYYKTEYGYANGLYFPDHQNVSGSASYYVGGCSGGHSLSQDIASASKAMNKAYQDRKDAEDFLRICENWDSQWARQYRFDPSLEINYSEPMYGQTILERDLQKNVSTVISSVGHCDKDYGKGDCSVTSVMWGDNNYDEEFRWECYTDSYDGKPNIQCKKVKFASPIPYKRYVEGNVTKTVTVKLKDGFYNYVLKPEGLSVHEDDFWSEPEYEDHRRMGRFYVIPTINAGGVYPVHYTTPRGKYDIGIIYSNLGHNGHIDEVIREYQPSLRPSVSIPYVYKCYYNVESKLTDCLNEHPYEYCYPDGATPDPGVDPDPWDPDDPLNPNDPWNPSHPGDSPDWGDGPFKTAKGMEIQYRPIATDDVPFPGISGKGRTPGENWNNPDLIEELILNNRGVKGTKLYQEKEPLYDFYLDTNAIRAIREYNKKQSYNYADFRLICENGKKCKSDFLRYDLKKMLREDDYKGICKDINSSKYYRCADKKEQ